MSKYTDQELRKRWIDIGLHDLHAFGYPNATADNILTDMIYAQVFGANLREAKDANQKLGLVQVDRVIDALLKEIRDAAGAGEDGE
jgi:hypothetical protein